MWRSSWGRLGVGIAARSRAAWAWLRWLVRSHPLGEAPVWVGVAISSVIGFTALLRGLDLVSNPPPAVQPTLDGHVVPTLNYYLEYDGSEWFGSFMLLTSLVVVVGLLVRRPIVLALGHVIGTCVYVSYLVVITQGLFISQDPGGHFAGLRTLATGIGAGALHLIRVLWITGDVRTAERGE